MNITFDIISVITALGIAQGLFLSVVIWGAASENRKANKILSITILVITVSISHGVFTYTNLYYHIPHMILTGLPLSFTLGPLCLLYLYYLTDPDFRFTWKYSLLFIPFIISITVLLPFYVKLGPEKLAVFTAFFQQGKLYLPSQVLGIISQVHMWIYLVLLWKKVSAYQEMIKEKFSTIDRINLSWIYYFIGLYAFSFVLLLPATLMRLTGNMSLGFERIVPLVAAVGFYYLGYRGFQQVSVYIYESGREHDQRKYERSGLNREEALQYKQELLDLMDQEKIYRDPSLNLNALAGELAINRNLVSQIINEEIGQNFYDFVNTYRVKDIIERLKHKQSSDIPLLHLAMDAGFNSKATFNSVFKKVTGKSPSSYKKELQPEE